MDKTKARALDKIKKCLRLSKSANEHEAAAALRQAQALMAQHGLDDSDVLASEVAEAIAKSGSKITPSTWEAKLCGLVAEAFGCNRLYRRGVGEWVFIGVGHRAETAGYAFAALRRQCLKKRAEHIQAHLRRCKSATKTRRADDFCNGWVFSVSELVKAFANSAEDAAAIAAYLQRRYGTLSTGTGRTRGGGAFTKDTMQGIQAGQSAVLHHGVGSAGGAVAQIGVVT